MTYRYRYIERVHKDWGTRIPPSREKQDKAKARNFMSCNTVISRNEKVTESPSKEQIQEYHQTLSHKASSSSTLF